MGPPFHTRHTKNACLHRKFQTLCKQWHYNRQQRHRTYGGIAEGSQNINVWFLLQIFRSINHPSSPISWGSTKTCLQINGIQWFPMMTVTTSNSTAQQKGTVALHLLRTVLLPHKGPNLRRGMTMGDPWDPNLPLMVDTYTPMGTLW